MGNPDKKEIFSIHWITYLCPLTRTIDFLIGCRLGALFLGRQTKPTRATISVGLEIAVITAIAASLYLYATNQTFLSSVYIRYDALFAPTTAALIWLIARSGGVLSKILQMKTLQKIGNVSPYTFLIHGLALKYCGAVASQFFNGVPKIVASLIALTLTFVAANIWIKLENDVFPWSRKKIAPNDGALKERLG